MFLFAATIFLGAFLLFLVQPIIAKQILPWFGGTAAVWTTCLVFFQTTLLVGYAYADGVVRKLTPSRQALLHTALLLASVVLLPIVPGTMWKPLGTENPLWLILGLLGVTIGLPYLLLSTTSPLLQAWFARRHPGRSPYRLFALSNLASMLALLGYPFLVEPWIPTRLQALSWSAAYIVFVLLAIATAWGTLRNRVATPSSIGEIAETRAAAPTAARQALWCALAATGSVLLLAVSTHITENIAAVPLLWIVPLAIYLLTFILCFDSSRWYRRDVFLGAAAAALGVMAWTMADPKLTHQLEIQLGVFCGGLFFACMFCHGELATLKPAPRYLTRFYLMVSLGGALGSALVGIVAPLVLPAYFELAIGLCACAALLLWQVRETAIPFRFLALAALLTATGCGFWGVRNFYDTTIATARNFYGVLRVQQNGYDDASMHRSLIHGTIMHGNQYLAQDLRRRPTTYYTATSGIGRVFEMLHPRLDPIKVGIIGLGTGTIAAWGTPGDVFRFYDINPAVVVLAKRDFTYLGDSEAHIDIPLGDARLTLEREAPQGFDVLAIDAFSSDAIPVHLITAEALDVYLRHMKPDGIIAFHVTNRFLSLAPVVDALAKSRGLKAVLISDDADDSFASRSDWVLIARNPEMLERPQIAEHASEIDEHPEWRLWTDDFNNLFQVLKR
ncbi:MAG TPA: fused MFS/spermidine synthase [Casimicrobiaceae bacterium]|nr:fused MFS/spermidine synthase [Casimicrobiaceae bacterium]